MMMENKGFFIEGGTKNRPYRHLPLYFFISDTHIVFSFQEVNYIKAGFYLLKKMYEMHKIEE